MTDEHKSSNLQLIRERWAECHAETSTYRDPWQAVNDIGDLLTEIERLTARVATQESCIAVNVREYLKLEAERDRLAKENENLKEQLRARS